MKNLGLLLLVSVLALALSFGSAYDPSPLQDFCVAIDEPDNAVFVNGKFCKNPKLVNATDFFFSGLNIPRNTSNPLGSTVTPVFVDQLGGLNTLGISMVRIDFGIDGVNPPHAHPRASEILVVLEGTLFVGFINSNPESRLFAEVLHPGDVFIFPIGMIHFQLNIGKTNAAAIAALSSQNPGIITIANAIFNSNPRNNPEVLTRAFQLDVQVVEELQKKFWYYNS